MCGVVPQMREELGRTCAHEPYEVLYISTQQQIRKLEPTEQIIFLPVSYVSTRSSKY